MSNTIKGNTVIDRLKKESPDAIMKLYCNGGPYVQCIRYKEYNAAKSIIFSSDITLIRFKFLLRMWLMKINRSSSFTLEYNS